MLDAHVLFVGPLRAVAAHEHHAAQIVWAPGGVELARIEGDRESWRCGTLHAVAPNRRHRHAAAEMAAVLWVDRDDIDWTRVPQGADDFDARGVDLVDALDTGAAMTLADALLAWALPSGRPRVPRHPAVRRMCRMLEATVDGDDTSIGELAAASGLSARQLRHRFTEALGVNPRAYRRWHRLRRSLAAIIERGATLTEGAVAGGFADGAHFSRVFNAQFGLSPSRALAWLHVEVVGAQPRGRRLASSTRK